MPISPSKSRDLVDENNNFLRNGNDSKQPYCHGVRLKFYVPVFSVDNNKYNKYKTKTSYLV
jgi:hypothetical protein